MTKKDLRIGTKVYWTRIQSIINTYDLYDLTVRTLYDTYFVAVDKRSKQSFIFSYSAIGKTVFENRGDALDVLKEAELSAKET